jgi:hypothetical protein
MRSILSRGIFLIHSSSTAATPFAAAHNQYIVGDGGETTVFSTSDPCFRRNGPANPLVWDENHL